MVHQTQPQMARRWNVGSQPTAQSKNTKALSMVKKLPWYEGSSNVCCRKRATKKPKLVQWSRSKRPTETYKHSSMIGVGLHGG